MQDRWRKFVVPAAVGLLLVPAAALAGTRMLADVDPSTPAGGVTEATAAPVAAEPAAAPDPLATACGPEAEELVAGERAEELTPVAQAALDALRPICEEAGRPLPDAPTPEPLVVVEEVPVPSTGGGASGTRATPQTEATLPAPPSVVAVGSRDDDHDDDSDDGDDDWDDDSEDSFDDSDDGEDD